MPGFQPFLMERMMSRFEQAVDYNLSESGVHPMRLGELLADDPGSWDRLLATELDYPHVNGIPELRANIARLYEGAAPENVLVTVGAAEANYIATRTLLSPGDEIVIMLPNYMQIWGIAHNHGLRIRTFRLREEEGWSVDLEELERTVTPDTKLIAVCNPNNPTGYILTEAEMDAIVAVAARAGAWILADEVYTGAERLADETTPSFYGRYERVVATGSLSKAYGLPGLRIGWVAGPSATVDEIWARHEYTTLSAGALANHVAAIALSPQTRPRILQRTRGYIREGYPVLEDWMRGHGGIFHVTPPRAAAIAFVRYDMEIGSVDLVDRLVREKSVLIVPGQHFGMDRFLRISFGLPHDYLTGALDRLQELIVELRSDRLGGAQ